MSDENNIELDVTENVSEPGDNSPPTVDSGKAEVKNDSEEVSTTEDTQLSESGGGNNNSSSHRVISNEELGALFHDFSQEFNDFSGKVSQKLAQNNGEIIRFSKRSAILNGIMMGILSVTLILGGLTWLSNNKVQSLADDLSTRINSFVVMDSLIETLSNDLDLAAISATKLESEILGFEGSLDIATEQISLRYEEQRLDLEEQVEALRNTVMEFGEDFSDVKLSNSSMEVELRRVIQSTDQLRELEGMLNAIVTLEKEKYYDAITALSNASQSNNEEELDDVAAQEMIDDGYIFFERD